MAKRPRDHEFPAIFQVCRLPFAVVNVKRPVFAFLKNVRICLQFFNRSATIICLCLSRVKFFFCFST